MTDLGAGQLVYRVVPTGAPGELQTRKGKRVNTPFTDEEALGHFLEMLGPAGGLEGRGFAVDLFNSLTGVHGLTAEQMIWVHILVVEAMGRHRGRDQRRDSVVAWVPELWRQVKASGRKSMMISVHKLRIKTAGPMSKHAGKLLVTDGLPYGQNQYYGTIDPETGHWKTTRAVTGDVREKVAHLLEDLEVKARAYAEHSGACGFCGTALTDGRSIVKGYGPICASNYGLPWGDETIAPPADVDFQAEGKGIR